MKKKVHRENKWNPFPSIIQLSTCPDCLVIAFDPLTTKNNTPLIVFTVSFHDYPFRIPKHRNHYLANIKKTKQNITLVRLPSYTRGPADRAYNRLTVFSAEG